MASKVVIFELAQRDFLSLPHTAQAQIAVTLRTLSEYPVARTGVKKLKPPFDGYRKRVGDYRILFDYMNGVVYVRRILNRKDAYR